MRLTLTGCEYAAKRTLANAPEARPRERGLAFQLLSPFLAQVRRHLSLRDLPRMTPGPS